jgi:solute carrier family 25 S-adenosylmethionine transporter 26
MPSVGLYFGVYSYCKKLFYPWLVKRQGNTNRNNEKFLWMVSIATSAAIGNTVASFSRVPYEVVKQKLQTGLYSTTWEALSDMARNQGGLLAFFPAGGVSIQMIRDIPYAIVTLLSYEYLKEHYVKPYKQRNNSTAQWCDMVAGAVAGGIGSYVTNPADVVKVSTTGKERDTPS